MDGSYGGYPPGTAGTQISEGEKGFARIEALMDTMGAITLSQVCAVTGLESTTIQNWVKRGWVANPKGKKYEESHIARILILNALKECFKLEQITLLMRYVNNFPEGSGKVNIKESELYNYLCQALQTLGQVDDFSRSGVESIVDKALETFKSPTIDASMRIRKALTVMIYACMCTDVKRGTEAMMKQVLDELDNPAFAAADKAKESMPLKDEKALKPQVTASGPKPKPEKAASSPTPKLSPMPAPKSDLSPKSKPDATTASDPKTKLKPSPAPASKAKPKAEATPTPRPSSKPAEESSTVPRKTIAQAIREWELISNAENRSGKPDSQE